MELRKIKGGCGEMSKQITIKECIDYVTKNACDKCNYYNKDFGVCGGELLPIERAILKNLSGMGCCEDVKEYIEKLKES